MHSIYPRRPPVAERCDERVIGMGRTGMPCGCTRLVTYRKIQLIQPLARNIGALVPGMSQNRGINGDKKAPRCMLAQEKRAHQKIHVETEPPKK